MPRELLDQHAAHRANMIFENDMAGELGGVRENAIIADDAVVRDVDIVHREDVAADARHHSAAFGAAMNGAELANQIVVADLDHRGLALELQVLRLGADRRELIDVVARANRGVAFDHGVGTDHGIRADANVGADNGARSDLDRRIELSAAVDHRGRMNLAGYDNFSSDTSIAESSASAAISPPTRASARIFHSGPRLRITLTSISS